MDNFLVVINDSKIEIFDNGSIMSISFQDNPKLKGLSEEKIMEMYFNNTL